MGAGISAGHVHTTVNITPVAYAAQAAYLLVQSAESLHEVIHQYVQSNPLMDYSERDEHYQPDSLISQIAHRPIGLQEHLLEQFHLVEDDPIQRRMGWFIINSLDQDGYFREDQDALLALVKVDKDTFNQALHTVQSLEPRGIAAQTLAECLQLQLVDDTPHHQLARTIVQEHLSDLASHRLHLAGVEEGDIEKAVMLIRRLDPQPGLAFNRQPTQYVRPDFLVNRVRDEFSVELINQPTKPVIPEVYTRYLHDTEGDDKYYVRYHLAGARAFLGAMEQREKTLLRIAKHVVSAQETYLKNLDATKRKRLTCLEVAQELDLSTSTISRAMKGKFLQCDNRAIPFESLFTSGGCSGISREQIVERIRLLLIQSPELSDQAIADLLKDQGIQIARRTVNKYKHQFLNPGRGNE